MKKTLLFALALAIVFASCKKKSNSDENPDDVFKLEYSNLTTEQHKEKIEEAGVEFIGKVATLPDQKFVSVLDYLSQLNPPVGGSVSSVLALGKAAKTKSIKGIFTATTSAVDTSAKLSELYGIYTWNPSKEEFDETASGTKLEVRFPSEAGVLSNNSILTITYVASATKVTVDGELAELPASITAVLKVNNREELKLTSAYAYNADGTPNKAETNLILGAFSLKTLVSNDGTVVASDLSFLKGAEVLLRLTTSVGGSTNVSDFNAAADASEIVKNANATFEIMNIKLAGQVDVKAIKAAEQAAENLSDTLQNVKAAEAWNQHAQFVAINKTDNTVIAKAKFIAASRIGYYSGTEFYLEPQLVFKDDSKMSFDEFFDTGFGELIDELNEYEDEFE